MDTTPILSQGLRFMPVARGDFLCIGERVEIPGRWEDKGAQGGDGDQIERRSEMQGMLIKKQALVKLLKSIVLSISDFRAMRR